MMHFFGRDFFEKVLRGGAFRVSERCLASANKALGHGFLVSGNNCAAKGLRPLSVHARMQIDDYREEGGDPP